MSLTTLGFKSNASNVSRLLVSYGSGVISKSFWFSSISGISSSLKLPLNSGVLKIAVFSVDILGAGFSRISPATCSFSLWVKALKFIKWIKYAFSDGLSIRYAVRISSVHLKFLPFAWIITLESSLLSEQVTKSIQWTCLKLCTNPGVLTKRSAKSADSPLSSEKSEKPRAFKSFPSIPKNSFW